MRFHRGGPCADEWSKYLSSDPALERRFQPVTVGEPDAAAARAVLQALQGPLSAHHRVCYTPAALDAAVALSQRYIVDRRLPDKVQLVVYTTFCLPAPCAVWDWASGGIPD